jgi:hypothetical protein
MVEDLLEVSELEHSNTSCKKGYHTVTCPLLLRSIDHAESNVRLQIPSPKPSKKTGTSLFDPSECCILVDVTCFGI